jgi:hypothetical protein
MLTKLLFMCALAACGAPNAPVETTSAQIATFARYHTFSFATLEAPPAGYVVSDRALEAQRLSAPIVARVLLAKGWQEVSEGGDFIIAIAAGTRTTQTTQSQSRTAVVISGDRVRVVETPEGALVVDAFDRATGERIWHGVAAGEVKASGSLDTVGLETAVAQMMRTFPTPPP